MLALDLRPMSRLRLRERPAVTSEWAATRFYAGLIAGG
jgi:hypothetical protein